ncbi:MAG: hypothetical protein AAF623_05595, partial [Planctomycetota bacterium]
LSGCSMLPVGGVANQAIPTADPAKITGQYNAHITGMMGTSEAFEGDIDGPITIQTVLHRSGVLRKYRNLDIQIIRQVEENGRTLKLPVKFNVRRKKVSPEQDYAIHPNDTIMISAMTANPLDKLAETFGPLVKRKSF